jgi:hypothetical protein
VSAGVLAIAVTGFSVQAIDYQALRYRLDMFDFSGSIVFNVIFTCAPEIVIYAVYWLTRRYST